jgi:hypothetical protein
MATDVFGTTKNRESASSEGGSSRKPRLPPSERQRYLKRLTSLKSERSSWDEQYREIGEGMLPNRHRKNVSDTNKGTKKSGKILNPVAQQAIQILAAGLMSGVTSPSRPWMRLAYADDEVMELESAKEHCWLVTTRMLAQLARTNFYLATAGSTYPDLAGFGTHATVVLKDQQTILRFYPLQVGEYWLASSARNVIDTLYREFQLTVAALVEEFGYDQCSVSVRRAWDNDDLDRKVTIVHAIEPNRDLDKKKADWRGKRWTSIWLEVANPEDKAIGLLRKSGHTRFPALTPRWSQDGQDTYGRGPGMKALPTHQQIQKLEYNLALQVALLGQPAVSAPAELQDSGGVNQTPGGVTYRPAGSYNDTKIESIHDTAAISVGIRETRAAIQEREQRIREFFSTDFWLAMLQDDRATPATAEEVRAKKEERMLQLGPVLEQIQCEFLEPVVDQLFDAMLEAGAIPPPPRDVIELLAKKGHGAAVFDVEYVSIAAAAQRALGLTNVRSFLEFVASGAQVDPTAVDLVDVDTLINEAARMLGINPKIVRAMPVVQQLRAARSKQQQAAETGDAMVRAAGATKDLGNTPAPSADNALGTALAALGPQASQLLPAPTSQMP